jgi:hypothetical protein
VHSVTIWNVHYFLEKRESSKNGRQLRIKFKNWHLLIIVTVSFHCLFLFLCNKFPLYYRDNTVFWPRTVSDLHSNTQLPILILQDSWPLNSILMLCSVLKYCSFLVVCGKTIEGFQSISWVEGTKQPKLETVAQPWTNHCPTHHYSRCKCYLETLILPLCCAWFCNSLAAAKILSLILIVNFNFILF